MFAVCESPRDLCKIVIDKYGIDAVYISICLRMTLEHFSLKKGGLDAKVMMQCPSSN